MNHSCSKIIWWVFLPMLLIVFAPMISADDDEKKHHGHERRHNEKKSSHDKKLKPVSNAIYADQCGACHFAYQPELLPGSSWEKILTSLDNHFGESVELDDDSIHTITDYLMSNSAEKSSSKRIDKIMRGLGTQIPLRITQIPYIKEEHHEISSSVLKQKSIGSLSNCIACHTTAGDGIYDDDTVTIPR